MTSNRTSGPLLAQVNSHSLLTPGLWLGRSLQHGQGETRKSSRGKRSAGHQAHGWHCVYPKEGCAEPRAGGRGLAAGRRRGTQWEPPTGPLALPWAPAAGPSAVATPRHTPFVCMSVLHPLLPGLRQEHREAFLPLSPAEDPLELNRLFPLQGNVSGSCCIPGSTASGTPVNLSHAPPPGSPPACTGSLPSSSFSSRPTPHPPLCSAAGSCSVSLGHFFIRRNYFVCFLVY